MTVTERAKAIRTQLKEEYGYTSKDISVRSSSYSMGSSISVTIKNPHIQIKPVEKIAQQAERIRYDKATGEILSGANTFVDIGYDRYSCNDYFKSLAYDMVKAAIVKIEKDYGETITGPMVIFNDQYQNGYTIVNMNNRDRLYTYSIDDAAVALGRYMVNNPETFKPASLGV